MHGDHVQTSRQAAGWRLRSVAASAGGGDLNLPLTALSPDIQLLECGGLCPPFLLNSQKPPHSEGLVFIKWIYSILTTTLERINHLTNVETEAQKNHVPCLRL